MNEIIKDTWKVHCVAECQTCGKLWHNYKNAQASAAIHAKKYGHIVTGEVGLTFSYDGRGIRLD